MNLFKALLGALLIVWCPLMLFARRLPRVPDGGPFADGFSGLLGGICGGLGGFTGAIPTLWCSLRGMEKNTQRSIIQNFNLTTLAFTMAAYLATGAVTREMLPMFAIVAPAMLIPVLLGARLYIGLSEEAFRKVVLYPPDGVGHRSACLRAASSVESALTPGCVLEIRLAIRAAARDLRHKPEATTVTKPKLLMTRVVSPAVIERARRDYDLDLNEDDHIMGADELVARCQGKDAALVTLTEKFTAEVIGRLPPSLRVIATYSVGFEHIDLAAAKARGIRVANTPDAVTIATAEIAMLLILGSARRAPGGRTASEGQEVGRLAAHAAHWAQTRRQAARHYGAGQDRTGRRQARPRLRHGDSLL